METVLDQPYRSADAGAGSSDGYHRNLLVLGARPQAARFTDAPAFHTLSVGDNEAPGFGLLSMLEQAGAVRQVYSLGRRAMSPGLVPASAGVVARLAASSLEVGARDPLAGISVVELQSEQYLAAVLRALAADPNVEFAARVPVRYLLDSRAGAAPLAMPLAQPPVGLVMWNLVKIQWQEARREAGFADAEAVRVAVLDTGIDAGHPDLAASIEGYVYAYDHAVTPVQLSDRDTVGHGTHVAGTIAAGIDNGIGVHGVCAARIQAYKIFDDREIFLGWDRGFRQVVDPIAYRLALRDCYDRGIEVVNLSIGGPRPPEPSEAALFRDLVANGTVVVAAMGNSRPQGSPVDYPGAMKGVIAVGASRPDDRYADFSSGGSHLALCAPGVAIWSTYPTYPGMRGHWAVPGPDGHPLSGAAIPREQDYGVSNGTSMAAPHVAAAAALLLANQGGAPEGVRGRLMKTADRHPSMMGDWDRDHGAGRLNLFRALFE